MKVHFQDGCKIPNVWELQKLINKLASLNAERNFNMAKKDYKKYYTPEQKYKYHSSREVSCGKYGLKYGGPKYCYSAGFSDGFHNIDNGGPIKREFGGRSGSAYALGNRRGKAEAIKYFRTTGKQPSDLRRFDD